MTCRVTKSGYSQRTAPLQREESCDDRYRHSCQLNIDSKRHISFRISTPMDYRSELNRVPRSSRVTYLREGLDRDYELVNK